MAKMMIAALLLVTVLTACVDGEKECLVCGEFNLVNLTKNDFNSEKDKKRSIRRTLNIDEFSGHDYYTIWSWSATEPELAWSEEMEKEVQLQKNHLKINPDGTWFWSIEISERYNSAPCFGDEFIEAQKNHSEYGIWTYVNENDKFIKLTRKGVSNSQNLVDFSGNGRFKDAKNISKSFEISLDNSIGTVTLRSIQPVNSNKSAEQNSNSISYSLLEGDIFLTLKEKINKKMVAKMK